MQGSKASTLRPQCPLWVKSRHLHCTIPCPLYPRKRTCAVQLGMSALGQKQTFAAQNVMSALGQKRTSALGSSMSFFILVKYVGEITKSNQSGIGCKI